jgi:hypothetical protein
VGMQVQATSSVAARVYGRGRYPRDSGYLEIKELPGRVGFTLPGRPFRD